MVEIKEFDHFGRGITKYNNKIVFIENAIPNETIEIKNVKQYKKYDEADVLKYIKKSKDRVNPSCPYYDKCGGCNIMHITYSKQLEFKQKKIEDIFKKYFKSEVYINKIVKCDYQYNYRNKITFQVNNDIGFFEKKSNSLINIDYCYICNEKINNSINYIKKLNLTKIKKIVCRANNNKLMIIIETDYPDIDIDILKQIADSIYIKKDNKYIHKYGTKNIIENIGSYKYLISPDSFFQVNTNVTKKLYDKIKSIVGTNMNIIDLYCGTGTIGIYVSDHNKVTGIEINKYAHSDALKNKEINNINNINFICGDSGKELLNVNFKPDIIIIDPPRNGLNKDTLNKIINIRPNILIYVSCEPMTLVRDLKILNNEYDIEEVTPYDMFPNTYHVETLTVLKKKH